MQNHTPPDRTVIISGASSGIGAETAQLFAKKNYYVVLLGRDEAKLKNIKNKCGEYATFMAFDLAHLEQNKQSLINLITPLPSLKVLVNNAGSFIRSKFTETKKNIWLHQFQINFLAAAELSQLCWPIFMNNAGGCIINIGSTLAAKPTADTSAYSAMKAALQNLTLSLAQAGGPDNIRVNCINPGIVDTPIHHFHYLKSEEKIKIQQQIYQLQLLAATGQPHHIAEAIYFLASEKSNWSTGAILNIDGGINIK